MVVCYYGYSFKISIFVACIIRLQFIMKIKIKVKCEVTQRDLLKPIVYWFDKELLKQKKGKDESIIEVEVPDDCDYIMVANVGYITKKIFINPTYTYYIVNLKKYAKNK